MFEFLNFELHHPWFLLLFFLFIPLFYKDFRKKKTKAIMVPAISGMQDNNGIRVVMALLMLSKYFILSALIIAMARPRTFTVSEERDETKGIDIILSVDVSLSMLARDLDPDRLTALQDIARRFIAKRSTDRLGLVIYSGEAFTKVPITSDHQVIIDEFSDIRTLELEQGTAIGEGLSVAVSHLKHSKAKSKIVILMTDGVNTIQNAMDPQVAAELAKANDIKVYSIGIGTNGYALMPTHQDIFGDLVFTETQVHIDESTLRDIAETTGGKYFRATSNESLEEVYNEINSLEKSDIKTSRLYDYQEYFRSFLWIALGILLLDAVLRWWLFKFIN